MNRHRQLLSALNAPKSDIASLGHLNYANQSQTCFGSTFNGGVEFSRVIPGKKYRNPEYFPGKRTI